MADAYSSGASIVGRKGDPAKRFWQSVTVGDPDACWEWKHALGRGGYGRLGIRKEIIQAHRFSWVLHFGEIADGQLVCHKCDNPRCVNPSHLFLGDHVANNRDRADKGRSRDQRGVGNTMAVLTDASAIEAYHLYEAGGDPKEIGRQRGVSRATILDVVAGRGWTHLGLPQSHRLARLKRMEPGFDLMAFADQLNLEARRRGASPAEISRATKVPRTVVDRALKCVKVPMKVSVDALAAWAGVPSSDFMTK